jgi:ketosteroid isomerase-like protein
MVSPAEACLVQWAELWSKHDIDGLLAIFDDDCIYEDVTFAMISRGKIELRAFANQILAALPDFHIELKHLVRDALIFGDQFQIGGLECPRCHHLDLNRSHRGSGKKRTCRIPA